jgi:hypothetical protein
MREIHNGKSIYNGVIDAFKTIYKKEGRKGLYTGMGTHLAKSIPSTTILFLVYELTVKFVNNHENLRKYF